MLPQLSNLHSRQIHLIYFIYETTLVLTIIYHVYNDSAVAYYIILA